MAIASNGQRTAHFAQPVQPASSRSVLFFCQPGTTASESTCGGHTATHQPQPVQRVVSMTGSALRSLAMAVLCRAMQDDIPTLRGILARDRTIAVVGLSAGRDKSQSGPKLEDNLRDKGAVGRCAVQIIDLERGDVLHEIRILGDVKELYDTAVLPGIRVPGTVGFMSEEIWNRINFVDPFAAK